ncbi:TraB/GumN family protein [Candidatus Woesearchaeota archaeon]|nr:TraB/GumN family protein [Candidatus Woesearchaeota archaeon]
MNLTIIGTSHIAKQSVDEIKTFIETQKPDIVAVELDIQRAAALMQEQKNKVSLGDILQIGLKGYIFVKIGQIVQEKLGKMVGVAPGSDMKTAINLAKKEKLDVVFIDQPIRITLKNFSKQLTWRERFRFLGEMVKGLLFPKKQMRDMGMTNFDLTKVPAEEVIEKLVGQMRQKYPSVYKTLISDRNKYMVKSLVKIMRKYPDKRILAVVGAGHKKGMEALLLKVDIVNE